MRIIIIGSRWLGEEVFDLCNAANATICAVAAPNLEDRLAIRALEYDVMAHSYDCIESICFDHKPDVILAAHCHAFISATARDCARFGCFAYHPSLLPRHRGRDAIEWAIRFGEPITGGTLYQMDDGADTGPIAFQEWCFIHKNDTAQSLWKRELAPLGLRLFSHLIYDLKRGIVPKLKAQDEALATFEPAITKRKLTTAK